MELENQSQAPSCGATNMNSAPSYPVDRSLAFVPSGEAGSLDEWLYNGGPYQLVSSLHWRLLLHGSGVGTQLSTGNETMDFRSLLAPVAAASAVFLVYPFGQGSFSDGMPLNFRTFNFMLVFRQSTTSSCTLSICLVLLVYLVALFSYARISRHVVLIRETTEESHRTMAINLVRKRRHNIVAAHGHFRRLIFQYASFNNSRSLHFFLAAFPVVGIWFTSSASAPWHSTSTDSTSTNPLLKVKVMLSTPGQTF